MQVDSSFIAVLSGNERSDILAKKIDCGVYEGSLEVIQAEKARKYSSAQASDAWVESLRFLLVYGVQGLALYDLSEPKMSPLRVDFLSGEHRHRRQFGGGKGQMIAKAVGLQGRFRPKVVDATAGLGGDAFVLASLGCHLQMVERSSIAYALLEDGLLRASHSGSDEAIIAARMSAIHGDAIQQLPQLNDVDVVYLDPMFPDRKKSAKVKKEMRVFHDLLGVDEDDGALLSTALDAATYRVVVKRPRIAPTLVGPAPTYQLDGKSCRYDIYAHQKMPT